MKTIVFIAPEFFSFHRQIETAMVDLGHKVYFIPDRPSQKAIIKILIRKARWLLLPWLNRYFRNRVDEITTNAVDEIFIIRGEGLSSIALKEMRARFPYARVQIYLWDSIARSRGCRELIAQSDRAWTYDLRDSKKYPELKFTPNFYVLNKEMIGKKAPPTNFTWNLAFFGTAHGDRMKVLSKISKSIPATARFYVFLYFQSPIMYWARKIFDSSFKNFHADQMGLKPKFGKEWEDVITKTSAILDIHHTQQGGLTIRTLESLALGFKLVTTDSSIKQYPFFNPRQILVIDRNQPFIPPEFLYLPNDFPIHSSLRELELPFWLNRFFD